MKRTITIFLALCALMARPAQAQDGEFEFELEEGLYIANGQLLISIREGNDELVECLRWAANQGKVEIGGCAQIIGLKVPGLKHTYAESWDELAATTGLVSIKALFKYTPELRAFSLFFPPFPDRLTAYKLYVEHASLFYVDYVVFNEIARTLEEEMPSAISETTWGFIKHRGFSRNAFRSKD